jgi:hypothetical protein
VDSIDSAYQGAFVNLKIKAFIYRLSSAFGHGIYLAQKEEDAYIHLTRPSLGLKEDLERGCWQAKHGFTSVWTWNQPWYKAFWNKLKHVVGK